MDLRRFSHAEFKTRYHVATLWHSSAFCRSAQRRRNVAAIHGGDAAGGLERHRLGEKSLGDVLGRDLAAEQVAAHIVVLRSTPRAFERAAIISALSRPERMRSAFTALARMPSAP